MLRYILAAALTLSPQPKPEGQSETAKLHLRFENATPGAGDLLVVIHDATSWAGGKPVRTLVLKTAANREVEAVVGLAPGRHAIKAVHDLDKSGGISLNPFGIPIEPYGFSGDAAGRPSWESAAFEVRSGENCQTITPH